MVRVTPPTPPPQGGTPTASPVGANGPGRPWTGLTGLPFSPLTPPSPSASAAVHPFLYGTRPRDPAGVSPRAAAGWAGAPAFIPLCLTRRRGVVWRPPPRAAPLAWKTPRPAPPASGHPRSHLAARAAATAPPPSTPPHHIRLAAACWAATIRAYGSPR